MGNQLTPQQRLEAYKWALERLSIVGTIKNEISCHYICGLLNHAVHNLRYAGDSFDYFGADYFPEFLKRNPSIMPYDSGCSAWFTYDEVGYGHRIELLQSCIKELEEQLNETT